MAYQLSFADQFGNTHPESYWRVKFLAVDLTSNTARAVLLGYKDKAAHDAKKHPVGQREYTVGGEAFQTAMQSYENGENPDLFALAYTVARTTKDVVVGDDKVSFFETAKVV